MAGHFPLALRQALQTGQFDLSRVSRWATFTHAPGIASVVDAAPYVDDWGSATFRLMNNDLRSRGGLQYPELSIELKNEDGFWTPGRFPVAWQGYPPQEFIYEFGATYEVDGTSYELVPAAEWSVVALEYEAGRAKVSMIHRLARYWGKRFGSADIYRSESDPVVG